MTAGTPSSVPDGWDGKRPRWLTEVDTSRTEGDLIADFAEAFLVIVKESIAGNVGDSIEIRAWQRELLRTIFALDATGKRQFRTALIGIARKNGKSALMACIAVYEFIFGPEGGEVLVVAKDREQAKIIFETCLSMLRRHPALWSITHKLRDTLTNTLTGTTLKALSRDALSAEGTSPSCAIVDEVHAHPDDKLWNVLQEGKGARKQPILIGITTAGARTDRHGYDTLCYRLYQHGRRVVTGEVSDPSFCFAWWEPEAGSEADHRDPDVWAESNPGLGDLVSLESFYDSIERTPEPEFRIKRTNQWVSQLYSALPTGRWAKLARPAQYPVTAGTPVVLGFDGAISNDSTALVLSTLDPVKRLEVVGLWERPLNSLDPEWRVDAEEVLETIRQACEHFEVVELAYDPAYWRHEMASLAREGINAVEYPCNASRMVPAWDSFYGAVMADEVVHDGNAALARHIDNIVLKQCSTGTYPSKESGHSKRKIDLGIASVIAVDRAQWHSAQPIAQPRSWLIA